MKSSVKTKRFITTTEISKMLGVHRTTVYYWTKRGGGAFTDKFPKNHSTSNTKIFLRDEVIAWAEKFRGYEALDEELTDKTTEDDIADMHIFLSHQATELSRVAEIILSAKHVDLSLASDREKEAVRSLPGLTVLLEQLAAAKKHYGIAEEVLKIILGHSEVITHGVAQETIVIEYGDAVGVEVKS